MTLLSLGDWPVETMSPAEQLATLPAEDRGAVLGGLSTEQAEALKWEWSFFRRPDQTPPDDFLIWLILGGRGKGKSRTGTEWVRAKGPTDSPGLIIGANPRDVRDIVLEGPSGILTISPPWERPVYEPTKLLLRWPNGAIAHVRSAEDPGSLRGLSVKWMYGDELVKWRYLRETWDQARLTLREGTNPQTVLTTTPASLPLIIELATGKIPGVTLAPTISTYRNAANLAPAYLAELLSTYEGTRLGLQEIHGQILQDVKGALWSSEMIEAAQWPKDNWHENEFGLLVPGLPKMRKVVSVDPSGSHTGDECGIIVTGASFLTKPSSGYVLADYSLRGGSEEWGRKAVEAYYDHNCEAIVAEVNYGGEMVKRVIQATPAHNGYPTGESANVQVVRAGKGSDKYERAIPIVGMFEQNISTPHKRMFLVGNFPALVGQLTSWVPPQTASSDSPASSWSPDRLDAMVWGLLYLMVIHGRRQGSSGGSRLRSASMAGR
ncbi:MAG TPA: terminase family protein [Acidimicrobiales bacterium]